MIEKVTAVVGDLAAVFELGIVEQVWGLDRTDDGLPCYDFAVAAARPGRIPTTSGFAVEATHGPDRLAGSDLVVVPAWPQLTAPPGPELADALRHAMQEGARLLTICSGTFLPAGLGLLRGRRATTHWQFADLLRGTHPDLDVDPAVLYVQDGPVLSSAGASAGIDACLEVVRQDRGSHVANALARRMVAPAHRAGGQAQFIPEPVAANDEHDLTGLLAWVDRHLDEDHTVATLSARAAMSPRTFARRFRSLTGTTPRRYLIEQRLHLVERLLETTDLPVETVAARAGFGVDTLRGHLRSRRGVSPSSYRHTFHSRRDP